ncbi:MAG: desulfoferrodoxin [Oligosphaeraceae bacterium]|nr:desulfoferrodoxin [Oligosphaeraceae bacterium]
MSKGKVIFAKIGVQAQCVEVLAGEAKELTLNGEVLKLQEERTADFKNEKHVPVLEKTADGWKVIVGSTFHPMEEEHYVQWIELLADGISYKQFLKPGMEPVAFFPVKAEKVSAREFCNLHGLWKA